MSINDADVIILGAGIAGLTAAEALGRAGLGVIIVEARDRIGGRILTHYDPDDGFPIELGPEFVHGRPPNLFRKLKQERLRAQEIKGEPWCREDDELVQCGEYFAQTERILEQMRYRKRNDTDFCSFLKRLKSSPAKAKERATAYVEGFNAADANEISVNSLVRGREAEEKIEGDRQFRVVGGYAALVEAIAKGLNSKKVSISLATIAHAIRWSKNRVEIQTRSARGKTQTYTAAKALVTLPLGVLQTPSSQVGAVRFEPALVEKESALPKLRMGDIFRVVLRFEERFWSDLKPPNSRKNLSRMTFLFSHDERFPTWWTAFPSDAPLLTGWSASRHARDLLGHPQSLIKKEAVAALCRILPEKKRAISELLRGAYVHNWRQDPFSRGAYSYVIAGGDAAQMALARPVQKILFFAGEATSIDGNYGTVHGAMTSGERAAKELLASY